MVMRDMHDQITIKHSGCQKTVSLITQNYSWLGLKKIVWYYIQKCYSYRCVKASKNCL